MTPPVPPYGHPDRGDQPCPSPAVIVIDASPADLFRRAATETSGRADGTSEPYTNRAYRAVAGVLDQAAQRWDAETETVGDLSLHVKTWEGCGGHVGVECGCFDRLLDLAFAVLGEGPAS